MASYRFTPLFSGLRDWDTKKSLSPEEKISLVQRTRNLLTSGNRVAAEVLYLLILEHYCSSNGDQYTMPTIPYGGSQQAGSIDFNLSEIPEDLQVILYKFLDYNDQVSS